MKAVAGLKKVILVCTWSMPVTPGNTKYTKYDLPGVQLSRDALAKKIPFVHSFLSVKSKIVGIH